MNNVWHDDQPIYKQLVAKLKTAILNNNYPEESALPSVRAISAELQINHITVSKAYHELLDEGLIEKRRGLGMFVKTGAINALLLAEKAKFLSEDLPHFIEKMQQLNIEQQDVIDRIQQLMMSTSTKDLNND
ncbi:GntR family transcriptional regulator [Saccharobesus litoralis]|uniref:GntR family transcriptional regulator n=1 Tax=Saccharobesus litoralis TaxID=2172099 RepID=A0A2S0VN34_9ALTE|nr:GntR family transcriptional regulator [Saccharobesus litoralis]AWB65633.1 GntR family transcriptional regulator [Saccharobesus litoralis]